MSQETSDLSLLTKTCIGEGLFDLQYFHTFKSTYKNHSHPLNSFLGVMGCSKNKYFAELNLIQKRQMASMAPSSFAKSLNSSNVTATKTEKARILYQVLLREDNFAEKQEQEQLVFDIENPTDEERRESLNRATEIINHLPKMNFKFNIFWRKQDSLTPVYLKTGISASALEHLKMSMDFYEHVHLRFGVAPFLDKFYAKNFLQINLNLLLQNQKNRLEQSGEQWDDLLDLCQMAASLTRQLAPDHFQQQKSVEVKEEIRNENNSQLQFHEIIYKKEILSRQSSESFYDNYSSNSECLYSSMYSNSMKTTIPTNQNIQTAPYPSSSLITEHLSVECPKPTLLDKTLKQNEQDLFYIQEPCWKGIKYVMNLSSVGAVYEPTDCELFDLQHGFFLELHYYPNEQTLQQQTQEINKNLRIKAKEQIYSNSSAIFVNKYYPTIQTWKGRQDRQEVDADLVTKLLCKRSSIATIQMQRQSMKQEFKQFPPVV